MQIQDFKIMFLIYKLLQFNQRLSATETNSPVEPHNPHPTMWPTVESLSRSFLLPPPPPLTHLIPCHELPPRKRTKPTVKHM